MSYIYAVYFSKQKAVKIGKADELKTRLSQLVATWGPISKARAWYVEDIFVIGAEKDLHRKFEAYHKDMPEGNGYSEFFEPDVWEQLDQSQFLPISKTKILNDVNQTKALAPKTYQSVTLTVTEHEKEQLLAVYDDTTTMKKYLLDSIDLLLTDAQYEQLYNIREKECIANLKRENNILKNQVGYHQSRANDNADKVNTLSVTKSTNVRKLFEQQEEIYQLKRELDIYKNQHVLSDNEQSVIELQLALSELQEQNKQLKNRVRELNQRNDQTLETSDKRRRLLKKARQTMKKTVTQLKKHKQKPYQTLIDELTDVIDDTYLYT